VGTAKIPYDQPLDWAIELEILLDHVHKVVVNKHEHGILVCKIDSPYW
jgi:hypothetical protein